MSNTQIPKLTKAQQEQLAYIKNNLKGKWFTVIDVFPAIKRGYYSLNRLESAGALISRINEEKEWNLKITDNE
jgi:hypothetical protein